jgi:anti-sigma factor RsiW
LKHPDAAEWMAFLYAELAPDRHRELDDHLAQCVECAAKMKTWRAGTMALDEWRLPAMRRTSRASWIESHGWWPALKWAAAVLVLALGFAFGRQTSPRTGELAALKTSVAQLAEAMQQERAAGQSNHVNVATAAANAETVRLLTQYLQLQESQRATDQQNLAVALRSFETRLGRLRAELETVALNTETGFEQTHENFSRLASFSAPVKSDK